MWNIELENAKKAARHYWESNILIKGDNEDADKAKDILFSFQKNK
jgi:hydroxymethylpyrimidine/phosphomethylpyrimidine kinase